MTLSSSGFHMPGAFHTDGIRQAIFRPPVSPASSPGCLPPVRSSSDTLTPKRKRLRDHARQVDQANKQEVSRFDHDQANSVSAVLITPAGRHVAQNGRTYTLAGQLDTPVSGSAQDGEILGDSMYSDTDYRKALGSKRSIVGVDSAHTNGPTSLFNVPQHPDHQSSGWSTLAFSTIGGVVGKVWEFCKTGAFKGFYAGGGRGFEMTSGEGGLMLSDGSISDRAWHGNDDHQGDYHHRVPGYFPGAVCHSQLDSAEDSPCFFSGASTPSGPGPAAKRRQTAPADDLGRNWVLVKDQVGDSPSMATPRRTSTYRPSPRNRNQGPSAVTGRRISMLNQYRLSGKSASAASCRPSPPLSRNYMSPPSTHKPPRPASAASFASPRSPSPTKLSSMASAVNASTASPTPITSYGHSRRRPNNNNNININNPSQQQQAFFPHTRTHTRTHSNASTASSRGATDDLDNSPRLTAEARQLAARRQREERDTDVRISAFNKQLQDMIRQGKEALGTTIEVDGEDGGWEDY